MRKAYIQPEAELLSLALLEDFLAGSSETGGDITDEDVTVNGGSNNSGEGDDTGLDGWTGGNANTGTGGTQPGADEWDTDGDWK